MADLLAVGEGKPRAERTIDVPPGLDVGQLQQLLARPPRNQVELGPDLGHPSQRRVDIPEVPVVDARTLGPHAPRSGR